METVTHRHVWQFRGQAADASLVMVCDDHDPPWVRLVDPVRSTERINEAMGG